MIPPIRLRTIKKIKYDIIEQNEIYKLLAETTEECGNTNPTENDETRVNE